MNRTEKKELEDKAMNTNDIKTLGALKSSGYQTKSIKDELRDNLKVRIKEGKKAFEGIHGYDYTVIPELERAILSKHNINLLGLRGQAKTRLARLMVNLLDEWIPVVAGSEINDDPLKPISRYAQEKIDEEGDETRIEWMHREDRFFENGFAVCRRFAVFFEERSFGNGFAMCWRFAVCWPL